MLRCDLGRGIVEIRHGSTILSTDRWLVVKKVLEDASKVSVLPVHGLRVPSHPPTQIPTQNK